VVKDAGLEWEPVQQALEQSTYMDSVLADHQLAMDLGLHGVPAFVFGNMSFTGAQPMEVFRSVANKAAEALQADPLVYNRQHELR